MLINYELQCKMKQIKDKYHSVILTGVSSYDLYVWVQTQMSSFGIMAHEINFVEKAQLSLSDHILNT